MTKNIDLVDVELFSEETVIGNILATAKENGVFVIMSNHDFFKTPAKEEIVARLRKMQEYGADIPKIAVMPESVKDVITLLDATNTMKTQYATARLSRCLWGERCHQPASWRSIWFCFYFWSW